MGDLCQSKEVLTNKSHKCEGCFKVIPKRSRVLYSHGFCDGEGFSFYLCQDCRDFLAENRAEMEGWFSPGEIPELRDCTNRRP